MNLLLTLDEEIARAKSDVRMGLPVAIDDWLVAAIETLSPARYGTLREAGPAVVTITARRAATLKARAYDGDLARICVPADASLAWMKNIADPAADMMNPLQGPFETLREGPATPHRAAIALAKSAQLLPALLMVQADAPKGVTALDSRMLHEALSQSAPLHPVAAARLPIAGIPQARLTVFRPPDNGSEHYGIEIGTPDRDAAPLVRLHSACFTGDVLGSLKCDCGPQLHAALNAMGEAGAGVMLYLNQEGRGIGLANKMRAYSLQDQGFDTVEANHRLGFEDDERDFRIGADMLRQMGFSQIRLLTNNPRKVAMMETHGIKVTERVALRVGTNPLNDAYLATKASKSGHLL